MQEKMIKTCKILSYHQGPHKGTFLLRLREQKQNETYYSQEMKRKYSDAL